MDYKRVDPDAVGIGRRVAYYRRQAGLTQVGVVERLNRLPGIQISYSWFTKMETGLLLLDSFRIIRALADMLQCTIDDLTGQPYRHGGDPGLASEHRTVPGLEEVLVTADTTEYTMADLRPMNQVGKTFHRLSLARGNAHFTKFGSEMPEVLHRLHAAAALLSGRDAERANLMLASAWNNVAHMAKKLGYTTLAYLASNRASVAAAASGDPLLPLMNRWTVAETHFKAGRVDAGVGLVRGVLLDLDALGSSEPPALSLRGTMHLWVAMAAAQEGDEEEAGAHLDEAEALALRLKGGDPLFRRYWHPGLNWGNVGVWRLSAAAEMHDPTALDRVRDQPRRQELLAALPNTERRSRCWIDIARVYAVAGDASAALSALEEADSMAPENVRNHPMSHEVIANLRTLEERTYPRRLRDMAFRVGAPEWD